jgi:hypothetical protein
MFNQARLAKFFLVPLLGLAFLVQPTTAQAAERGRGNDHPPQVFSAGPWQDHGHPPKGFAWVRAKHHRYLDPYQHYRRAQYGKFGIVFYSDRAIIVLAR